MINGQVRKGLRNILEVHVGKSGKINIQAKKPIGMDVPPVALRKIGDLKPDMINIDVLGRVTDVGQIREFVRSSGELGRVGDLYLLDDSGSVRLSLWDDQADELKNVSRGSIVLVEGAYTAEGSFGISLSLGKMGSITINPDMKEAESLPVLSEMTKINQLKANMPNVNINGTISEEPTIRTVKTKDGQEVTVASFRIQDDTGDVRISLWRELASKVENLLLGTRLILRNLYTRVGFDGSIELSSRSTAEIEILSKSEGYDDMSAETANMDHVESSKMSRLDEESMF